MKEHHSDMQPSPTELKPVHCATWPKANGTVNGAARRLSWPKENGLKPEAVLELRNERNASDAGELKLIHCSSFKTSISEPESPTMHSSMFLKANGLEMLGEQSKMQLRWERAMCDELGLPQGYRKVSVLFVKWNSQEDQFKKTEEEVNQLKSVFQDSFGYRTRVVDISGQCTCLERCKCTPQDRLDLHIGEFMRKYDRPTHLTIIYYTGHGTYFTGHQDEQKYLKLHASDEEGSPELIWDHSEHKFIRAAQGDVLTIMDACFAGAVRHAVDRESSRTYEYLAACHAERTTPAPGEKSFTTALIASLRLLLDQQQGQAFTTADLVQVIESQDTRKNNPPNLICRSEHDDRRIVLAPIGDAAAVQNQEKYFDEKSNVEAHLTLQIELKQAGLDSEEVEELARLISKAVHSSNIKTRRVDLLKLSPRKKTSFPSAARWARAVSKLKSGKYPLTTIAEVPLAASKVPITRPGLFATFGVMDWNSQPHIATFYVLKPWTRVLAGAILVTAVGAAYFRRTWQSPLNLVQAILGFVGRSTAKVR